MNTTTDQRLDAVAEHLTNTTVPTAPPTFIDHAEQVADRLLAHPDHLPPIDAMSPFERLALSLATGQNLMEPQATFDAQTRTAAQLAHRRLADDPDAHRWETRTAVDDYHEARLVADLVRTATAVIDRLQEHPT